MNPNDYDDFVSAVGEEFSTTLASVSDDICGVDMYAVVTSVFPLRLSPELLANITSEQTENLRARFCGYFEVADHIVTTEQIGTAIFRMLRRWPPKRIN